MSQCDVSVIVTTWNSSRWIQACLESLQRQTGISFEIILVDNGSTDRTKELVSRLVPNARFLFLSANAGPAKARNLAMAQAIGRYILTLDSDVVLEPAFLRNLVGAADVGPERVGMWNGKILRPDLRAVDSTGIVLSKRWRAWDRGGGEWDRGEWEKKDAAILGPSACAALYRRTMLEEIKDEYGYFDERFFFLWEDVDLAWRAQSKGWKAAYVPSAVAAHARNGSGLGRRQRQALSFRNRYLFIRKHHLWRPLSRYILHCGLYEVSRFSFILFTNPSALFGKRGLKKIEDGASD